ncbi:FCD domain-containing protein, partial [Microvirga sp. 3-52]|nr:FCD domain-containing protein [Microvirga sp. 3-52]
PNLTEEQLTLLEDTNSRFAKVIDSEDYFKALKIDEEFHQIIVDAADNPYIFSIVDSLQAHVRRLFFHNSIVLTRSSIDEHNDIIKLMRDKDVESVSTLMRKNWLRAIEKFRMLNAE